MSISIELKETFPVKPSVIYDAWLNSEEHGKMTGGTTNCSDLLGGEFSVWDGYITGKNTSLEQDKKIVQQWRSTEFKDDDEDSELIVDLKETEDGCELTLTHNNIPEGQPDYKQGWIEHYFNPMKVHFGS